MFTRVSSGIGHAAHAVSSIGIVRVAVITESFLPTVNGVTTSVCQVLDHLRANGHDATVITPAAGAPAEYAGFPVHQLPTIAYRQFPVGLPSPHVQRILGDFCPDVLHAASPFLLGAQGILAAKRIGVPSVAIFQTDVAGYARRNRLGAATRLAWRLVRWAHDGADVTLVPSSASMRDLEAAGVQRMARWGRGVDVDRYHPNNRFSPGVQRLRTDLAPDGEVIVGYVGRIAPEKQLERLRALRGMRGIRIVLVGDGPSMGPLTRRLDGMPVTWLGRRSGTELADAYASFDLFLHTGAEETFGQTLQEAHASGLPVIAPRAGGPMDLIAHGVDGLLFDPASKKDADLRRHVDALVGNAAARHRMGEAGRRRVRSRTWDAACTLLVGHYETAIAARRLVRDAREY